MDTDKPNAADAATTGNEPQANARNAKRQAAARVFVTPLSVKPVLSTAVPDLIRHRDDFKNLTALAAANPYPVRKSCNRPLRPKTSRRTHPPKNSGVVSLAVCCPARRRLCAGVGGQRPVAGPARPARLGGGAARLAGHGEHDHRARTAVADAKCFARRVRHRAHGRRGSCARRGDGNSLRSVPCSARKPDRNFSKRCRGRCR